MSKTESQILDDQQEIQFTSHGPRRFIFNLPETKMKSNYPELNEAELIEDSDLTQYIPLKNNFLNPLDYKEGYELLVSSVLGAYNYIHLKLLEKRHQEFVYIFEQATIQKPADCLTVFKNLLVNCCNEIVTKQEKEKDNVSFKDYEELLQKAEAKIRVFIRNEQIFRLNFEILTQRIEDSDKGLQAAQRELNAAKATQNSLIKENIDLTEKLQKNESELRQIQKDCEYIQQKYKEARESLIAIGTRDKVMPGFQNITLKENKYSPKELNKIEICDNDHKISWNDLKQPSMRHLAIERNQHERRAHIASNSFLNTSSENYRKTEKPKNSLINELKKTIDSHRTALNVSSDVGLNKSTERSQERNTINNIILGIQKRNQEQSKIINSQDHMRIKIPSKERKQGEFRDKDFASFLTNRNTLQKITSISNKYTNIQVGLASTRRCRDSSLAIRNPILLQTEQSPDAVSQDLKTSKAYSSAHIDIFHSPYAGSSQKKSIELKEEKSQTKAATKNSLLIKNMIAEQLNQKLNGSKYI